VRFLFADLHTVSDLEELLTILEAVHGVPPVNEAPLPPPKPRPFALPLPARPPLLAKLLAEDSSTTIAEQAQEQEQEHSSAKISIGGAAGAPLEQVNALGTEAKDTEHAQDASASAWEAAEKQRLEALK
jgi:hypothetical protein